MRIAVFSNAQDADNAGAAILKTMIRRKVNAKLGLATGSSPVGIYRRLVESVKRGELSFKDVSAFNLDEYVGLSKDHPQSYATFMREHLFDHVDINPDNIHIPRGDSESPEQECDRYERLLRAAGQLDVQVLGIGLNGHIGFNEPGPCLSGETHLVKLTENTRDANALWFPSYAEIPKYAITMGLGTIMKARKVLFIAHGKSKSNIVKEAFTGPITTSCPASFLQLHPDLIVLLDEDAASGLTGDSRPSIMCHKAKRIEFLYDPSAEEVLTHIK